MKRLTGSTKYPEHFGLTKMGGPLVAIVPPSLGPLELCLLSLDPGPPVCCCCPKPAAVGVIANKDILRPIVPLFEDELWDLDLTMPVSGGEGFVCGLS